MRIIEREMTLLTPPDGCRLDPGVRPPQTTCTPKQSAGRPPDVAGLERLGATRMRQYVRAWINEWDLVRLDPQYRPQSETVNVVSDYREDATLDEDTRGATRRPSWGDHRGSIAKTGRKKPDMRQRLPDQSDGVRGPRVITAGGSAAVSCIMMLWLLLSPFGMYPMRLATSLPRGLRSAGVRCKTCGLS